jgi:hypothetical protein
MWSDENPSSGYNDTQASFGSISLVAKKLTSLSKVSSSLEEDAPGLLPAHPRRHAGARSEASLGDKRVVEGVRETAERYALDSDFDDDGFGGGAFWLNRLALPKAPVAENLHFGTGSRPVDRRVPAAGFRAA